MASSLLRIFNRTSKTHQGNAIIFSRTYYKDAKSAEDLYRKIMPLGNKNARISPVLDQWLQRGGHPNHVVLSKIIKELRSRKRFGHALEIYEWIRNNRAAKLTQAEHAIQLGLIFGDRGLEAAESYFQSLDSEDKVDKTYGALLYCYTMAGEVEKSISLMQKMKALGLTLQSLNYNGILTIHMRSGQFEKVPHVISEMKESGLMPDIVSYTIWINSCGRRGDIDGMEKVLQEAESQQHIVMNWRIYATVALNYIEADQENKALAYLTKCEAIDENRQCYNDLISLYALLGNKDEMMRLWDLIEVKFSKQSNLEYVNILGGLTKLGEFEECEKLLEKWEASCHYYDSRVPNTLLIGYSKKGLVEKAEAMLLSIIERRKFVVPTSWSIIAEGYQTKQNMEKAFECMKSALALQAENKWWRPQRTLICGVLSWLGDHGNIEDVLEFVRLLEMNGPRNREMYHALITAHIREGKPVDELVNRMKDDKLERDEETEKILSSV